MQIKIFIAAVLLLIGSFATGSEKEMFPFVISYDNPDNITSAAQFLEAPAGKNGFVKVHNGKFYTDAGEIRFHATNITGPANFPTHENADKIAERFARLGINCVRLHFMDTWYINFMTEPTQGILADNSVTQRNLDPKQLDKLDYMIFALKKKGVYIDLNLHVGRTLDQRDGFAPNTWANKGFDQFVSGMIELQKEYARQLLTHVNKYTGKPYTDEPAIAMIEITNEDTFQGYWFNGMFDRMDISYKKELKDLWNRWLHKKYKTLEDLQDSWNVRAVDKTLTDEQIVGGSFENTFETDSKNLTLKTGTGKAQMKIAHDILNLNVTAIGDDFCPKIYRKIDIKKGELYTVSFKIRRTDTAGDNWKLSIAMADLNGGWSCLGLQKLIPVDKKWTAVSETFYGTKTCGNAFLQLSRFIPGQYEIDDLSIKKGGKIEDPVINFSTNDVPVPLSSAPLYGQYLNDFGQFMEDTETDYWLTLYRYIKNDLKAKAPVSGTQISYSAEHVQALLDYCDIHAYWRHPTGGWISLTAKEPWKILNDSMVNSLQCVLNMANRRVAGKPFTVSEYNHPYPNQYGAEAQPFLAVFGRLQGWNGIFQYTYNHYVNDWAPQANPWCFFDMIARTEVLAHFPACSAMFLRGDISESKSPVSYKLNMDDYRENRMVSRQITHPIGKRTLELAAVHKVESCLDGSGLTVDQYPLLDPQKKILVSDTGEIVWNREIPNKSYVAVNTKQSKLFTGFPEGRTIDWGNMKLRIGKTQLDWATVSLFSKDANGFGESGKARALLAATGNCGNSGRIEKKLDGPGFTLTDRGHAPVIAEGINATLVFDQKQDRIKCFALDSRGERKSEVPIIKNEKGQAELIIGPQYKTVWYELLFE